MTHQTLSYQIANTDPDTCCRCWDKITACFTDLWNRPGSSPPEIAPIRPPYVRLSEDPNKLKDVTNLFFVWPLQGEHPEILRGVSPSGIVLSAIHSLLNENGFRLTPQYRGDPNSETLVALVNQVFKEIGSFHNGMFSLKNREEWFAEYDPREPLLRFVRKANYEDFHTFRINVKIPDGTPKEYYMVPDPDPEPPLATAEEHLELLGPEEDSFLEALELLDNQTAMMTRLETGEPVSRRVSRPRELGLEEIVRMVHTGLVSKAQIQRWHGQTLKNVRLHGEEPEFLVHELPWGW